MLTSADLNRDGILDLIVASASGLMAGLGQSDGRVDSPAFFYATYTVGGAIAVADVDGDGWPDVVASANVPDRPGIWAFINDGTGNLNSPAFTPTPGRVVDELELGDLVSAEPPDLVVSAHDLTNSSVAQVIPNTGNGTFGPPVTLNGVGASPSGALLVGDLNQDGLADIVGGSVNGNSLVMLINQGDGGYQQHVYSTSVETQVALLPRPGRAPDLLVEVLVDGETGILLLRNAGDGTFSIGPTYPVRTGSSLLVGDFNNDCVLDIATTAGFDGPDCGNGAGGVSLLYGDGDGGFGSPVTLPYPASDAGGEGLGLAVLGPVGSPHALAVGDVCRGTITIYGDASK